MTSQGVQHRVFYLDVHPSRYQLPPTDRNWCFPFGDRCTSAKIILYIPLSGNEDAHLCKLLSFHAGSPITCKISTKACQPFWYHCVKELPHKEIIDTIFFQDTTSSQWKPLTHLMSGSQAGVVNINHAFHLYYKCCMWIEFQSISTWLRGFSLGTPVSSLLKIDSQSNPSGCGAVLQGHTWTV